MSRRSQSLDRISDNPHSDPRIERRTRRQFMHLIAEKNDQIEKLIKRVTILHSLNNEFAVEHEQLQKELVAMREKCERYDEERQMGCESCRLHAAIDAQHQNEVDTLLADNKQMANDAKMLKMLIYRLNVQLERYQEMLRKRSRDGGETSMREASVLTPSSVRSDDRMHWGSVETNTLAPLLNAYQETINDKTELLHQHEMELDRLAGQFKDLLDENEHLHEEMDTMRRCNDDWTEEQTRLRAQLDVCRNQAEVHSKRADLAKEKLREVVRCYEQKIQTHTIDMERMQEAYSRLKGEQITCKTIHQQPEMVIEKLKECQQLLDETKAQHSQEKTKLNDEVDELRKSRQKIENENQSHLLEITELRAAIQSQKEKIESLEAKSVKMRQHLIQARQSREHLRQTFENTIRNMEETAKCIRTVSSQDLHRIEQLLIQKDMRMQQLHSHYKAEIDKMNRKLTRRDETLQKVLLTNVRPLKK